MPFCFVALGNIVSRSSLIGDLELQTCGNGFINLRKIQGNKFEMSTEHGRVGVSSLYGTHVTISTSRGHVDIGDAHGELVQERKTQVVFFRKDVVSKFDYIDFNYCAICKTRLRALSSFWYDLKFAIVGQAKDNESKL